MGAGGKPAMLELFESGRIGELEQRILYNLHDIVGIGMFTEGSSRGHLSHLDAPNTTIEELAFHFGISLDHDASCSSAYYGTGFLNTRQAVFLYGKDGYLVALKMRPTGSSLCTYDLTQSHITHRALLHSTTSRDLEYGVELANQYYDLVKFVKDPSNPEMITEGLKQTKKGYLVASDQGSFLIPFKKPDSAHKLLDRMIKAEEYTRNNGYSELGKHKLLVFLADSKKALGV